MAQLNSIDNKTFISLKPLYIENHDSGDDIVWITSELQISEQSGNKFKVTSAFLTVVEYKEILNGLEQISISNLNRYSAPELIEPMFGLTISVEDSNVVVELFYNEDFNGDEPEKKHVIRLTSTKHLLGAFSDDLQKEFDAVNK